MERIICALTDVDADSVALVGGKGANLGELVAAGVPVPLAFCVTTIAYRRHVAENGLVTSIESALDAIDYTSQGSVEQIAASIRAFIMEAPMPLEIEQEITAAYGRTHDGGPVSVRSSATAEDLPGTSFAGQQDTYLHISGATQVVDAVKRCWASLWTDRAVAYRHAQGFAHESVLLAVVVQEMFPSEVSGVLFTANPVTSNPFEFFLNASWGLGEAVVSGQVNPDQLVIAKDSREIVDRRVADKERDDRRSPVGAGIGNHRRPRGSTVHAGAARRAGSRALRHRPAHRGPLRLPPGHRVGLGRRAFRRPAGPRDHRCRSSTSVTSSRPGRPPKALADMYDERWTWSRAYSDEVQTGPSTPSFYTYLQLGMTNLKAKALSMTWTEEFDEYTPETFLDFPYFRWYGARAYYNLTFEQERIRRFIPPFARDEATLWPFPTGRSGCRAGHAVRLGRVHVAAVAAAPERYDVSLLGTTQVIYEGLERWTDEEDAFWDRFDLDSASVAEIFAAQLASRQGSTVRRERGPPLHHLPVHAASVPEGPVRELARRPRRPDLRPPPRGHPDEDR